MCSYRCETDEVVVQALRPFGTSIFTEMSVPANAHGAVNLSQGFPDFDGPEAIRHKAAEAIKRGPNQYVILWYPRASGSRGAKNGTVLWGDGGY